MDTTAAYLLVKCRPCKTVKRITLQKMTKREHRGYGRYETRTYYLTAHGYDRGYTEQCPCGRWLYGEAIKGKPSASPCDPRCTGATGPDCECQCSGANHGADYARETV